MQNIALVKTVPANNGSELATCTQTGIGNILATVTNPNPNPNATGTVTITQSTSSYSNSTEPALCYVVAFDANSEAIVVAVGLQLSGGGPAPQTLVDTVANILAACVNSSGPGSAACTTLFTMR